MQRLLGFILNWSFLDFLDFYEKNSCKKKRFSKIIFTNKKILILKEFENIPEKNIKISKPFEPKIFSVGQPCPW